MKSVIDGCLYSYNLTFSDAHPKGIWNIVKAPHGRSYISMTDKPVWSGAEGEGGDDNGEPPKAVRDAYEGFIGFSRKAEDDSQNLVEMIQDEDDDCAFDQPCKWGHRVESHAVYCHNPWWLYGPRKCRRHNGDSPWSDEPWPHEGCAGFEPNDKAAS